MQRLVVDLLTMIAARRGARGAELSAWVTKRSDETGFLPSPLAAAETALARGDFADALAVVEDVAEKSARVGLRRSRIVATV